jgi:hypothetical protein
MVDPILSAGEITSTSIQVQWNPQEDYVGAYNYILLINGVYHIAGSVADLSDPLLFTKYGLTPETEYTFILQLEDIGESIIWEGEPLVLQTSEAEEEPEPEPEPEIFPSDEPTPCKRQFRISLENDTLGKLVLKGDPIGWEDTTETLRRDERLHGVFWDYTLKLEFYCGAGKEFIDAVILSDGIDGEITILI